MGSDIIKEVNTYFVRPRWGFFEITTKDGVTGWGEAVLEGHALAVLSCVKEMQDYLIGKDPADIEGIWETLYRAGFYRGGIDIIQPDLSHVGGITEVKKIAAMAESYDIALAPHCPLGPIALAACLNVDATSYNAVIQEQSIGIHYNVGKSVLNYVNNKDDFKFTDGFVELPKFAGLGVDVNREPVIEENKNPHNWKNPVWHYKDGSVAEW